MKLIKHLLVRQKNGFLANRNLENKPTSKNRVDILKSN